VPTIFDSFLDGELEDIDIELLTKTMCTVEGLILQPETWNLISDVQM